MLRIALCLAYFSALNLIANAEEPRAPLTRLAAGIEVSDADDAAAWNRVVLVAQPRIASGDVDRLSASLQSAVSTLSLTIMANVKPIEGVFRLDDVGIGYSVPIGRKIVLIDSENAARVGASLGFIQRQILSQNETRLADAKVVARTSTLVLFEVPGLMFVYGAHRDVMTRHLVWVESQTGRVTMAVWCLQKATESPIIQVTDHPLTLVAGGTMEDRKVHVDGESFFLGIPSERAFALESLPPGKSLPWHEELRELAATSSFDRNSISKLVTAINDARKQTKE